MFIGIGTVVNVAAVLVGFASIAFAASLGWGVAASAVVVLVLGA